MDNAPAPNWMVPGSDDLEMQDAERGGEAKQDGPAEAKGAQADPALGFVETVHKECPVFCPHILIRRSTTRHVVLGGVSEWAFEEIEDGPQKPGQRPGGIRDLLFAGQPWILSKKDGRVIPSAELVLCFPFEIRRGVVEPGPPSAWITDFAPICFRPGGAPVFKAHIDNRGPSASDLLRPQPLPGQGGSCSLRWH